MDHATVRSFADLGAISNNVSKNALKAANEHGGNVARIAFCADDVRQGVTGHNVRYILGFSILGAVIGLTVAAMLPG